MATLQQKTAAKAVVQTFKVGPEPGVWPAIDKANLAAEIEARIDDPDRISQKSTPLCGPATTTRVLALDDPMAYAQAIIDLYTTGTAQIGQLVIDPRDALRGMEPVGGIAAADWILAAGIRNSENYVFSLAYSWTRGTAGITLPSSVYSWLEAMGYTDLIDRSHAILRPGPALLEAEVQEASHLYGEGYHVCILVDGDVMREGNQDDFFSAFPTHWIGLDSPILFGRSGGDEQTISFRCYSWGQRWSIPVNAANPLAISDFLNKYYGFVAARR